MNIYIFNELSTPFYSVEQAKNELAYFINTCMKANSLGFEMLHLHQNIGKYLFQLQIAPNYTLSQWLQDSGIEKELKSRFRSITTQTPLITDDYPIEKERNELSEFKIEINHKTEPANGLGAAFLLETLCVSFLSHDLWDTFQTTASTNPGFLGDAIDNVSHQNESHQMFPSAYTVGNIFIRL